MTIQRPSDNIKHPPQEQLLQMQRLLYHKHDSGSGDAGNSSSSISSKATTADISEAATATLAAHP
jgi:hypothetical protein